MSQRRKFMQTLAGTVGGAIAGTALTACGGADAAPASNASFLLIHGAWHSSQCWNPVMGRLAAAGLRVHALDLPGAGLNARYPQSFLAQDVSALATEISPLKDVGLQAYEDATLAQLRAMASVNGPVILVGHSYGGCTITRVAEKAPELVRRVVYLTAFAPVRRKSLVDYTALPQNEGSLAGLTQIGDPAITGAVRINNRSADIAYVENCRRAFYNDVSTADFLPYAASLVPDVSLKGFTDEARGTPGSWGMLPRTYIRCTMDQALPIELQDLMIAEADEATPGNRFDQHTLVSSHSPFASMPDKLAAILASLA